MSVDLDIVFTPLLVRSFLDLGAFGGFLATGYSKIPKVLFCLFCFSVFLDGTAGNLESDVSSFLGSGIYRCME